MPEALVTSRAIQLVRFAASFREAIDIVHVPARAPMAGELQVRNRFCGINGIFDTQIARDAVDYIKLPLPSFTGVEAIGTVEAIGDGVEGFSIGDPVATTRFGGGYRELGIAPASAFVRVPAATADILTLVTTGVSALLALEHIGEVRDGETVAISAAAGGLGHLLVQLALLRGCTVIAVCGGGRKADMLRRLGAHRVVDYRSENLSAVLQAEYPAGLNVALDSVSGGIFDAFLTNMAPHGRLVVSGAAQDLDGKPEIVSAPRIAHSIYYKGVSVRGFMNGLLGDLHPAARERLFKLYADGLIEVVRDDRPFHGIDAIPDAVEWLLSGKSMGKVLVDL
ncbi:zinc-binding dehydrogenase [Sphingomonas radiodurans]|uniref:zinc-binding dehydrogenase n=1 Tax=Sphingomonas radiodurans TaxID=2890321 RepID=UPI001E64F8FF|nr:zinc-binding dehydrogenase [Sphingomonas radiodurans]WBH18031.1 zinc-binding dehydrogenase [Sphingomonas radiodurans]